MTTLLGEIFVLAPDENLAETIAAGGSPNVTRDIYNAGLGRYETLVFVHMMPFGPWQIGNDIYDTAPLEISFPYADVYLPQLNFPLAVYLINIPGSTGLANLVALVREN